MGCGYRAPRAVGCFGARNLSWRRARVSWAGGVWLLGPTARGDETKATDLGDRGVRMYRVARGGDGQQLSTQTGVGRACAVFAVDAGKAIAHGGDARVGYRRVTSPVCGRAA